MPEMDPRQIALLSALLGQGLPDIPEIQPTQLNPEQEGQFQNWIRQTPWFKEFIQSYGEMPNLNDPNYNYRGAWLAGVGPGQGAQPHWPDATPSGEWLKSPHHPTAWANPFIGQYGINPDELSQIDPRVLAFSQAWHEKYPPRYQ